MVKIEDAGGSLGEIKILMEGGTAHQGERVPQPGYFSRIPVKTKEVF